MVKLLTKCKSKFKPSISPINTWFKPITSFKCPECGETDQDLAEKYCGNSGCKYRNK